MHPIKAHELSHMWCDGSVHATPSGRISRSRQPITTCSEAASSEPLSRGLLGKRQSGNGLDFLKQRIEAVTACG